MLYRKQAITEANRAWKALSAVDKIEWKWKAQESYMEVAEEIVVHRMPMVA